MLPKWTLQHTGLPVIALVEPGTVRVLQDGRIERIIVQRTTRIGRTAANGCSAAGYGRIAACLVRCLTTSRTGAEMGARPAVYWAAPPKITLVEPGAVAREREGGREVGILDQRAADIIHTLAGARVAQCRITASHLRPFAHASRRPKVLTERAGQQTAFAEVAFVKLATVGFVRQQGWIVGIFERVAA